MSCDDIEAGKCPRYVFSDQNGVAQPVERKPHELEVDGSNPSPVTKIISELRLKMEKHLDLKQSTPESIWNIFFEMLQDELEKLLGGSVEAQK